MEREGTAPKGTPAQSYIIKRPRLTKLLDESEARIILLVAPAGYGKTTLAREWLSGRDGVAWYSGRPATADVAALASGLVFAFINDEDERDRAIERVQILAGRGQPPDALARTVASAISASTSILVIDDCHCASSAESEALLSALTLETSLRVVLTSRTRPRWVTSRMVVYREATILEMSDLAFTNEEARAVIGQSGDEATLGLITKARGWPAVIGLAVHHGTSDLDGHLPSSDLYEFFAEDLFRRGAPDLQRGLILLALGGDTNTDVARTVLGKDHEAILSAALDHGFLGQRTGQLEIHPLLRTFLLEQLDHIPPADARDTVTLVVKVLAANGMWDECLSALQCYPISALISSILSESLPDLLASGRINTVRRWVDLARSNHANDPMLVLAEAEIALRDRDDPRAQILGARAATLLGAGDASARAYIVAARAAHFRDDLPAVKEYTDLAMSCTANSDLHATALWTAFSNAAERSETEARAILDRLDAMADDRPEHALRLLNAQALMLANRGGGSVRAVAEKTELARALLPHVRDPFLTTNALNVFAAVAVVLARYESALSLADEMLKEATSSGLDFALDHALLVRASALIGLRKLAAAQRALNEIEHRSDRISTHIVGNLQLQKARLKIASGDLERASQLLECHPPEPLPEVYATELLAHRGLVFAALGDAKRATDAFAEVQIHAAYAGSTFLCDLGKAVLLLRQGEPEERCVSVLLRIIDEGHLDAIVVAARAFPGLVRAASTNDTSARALTQILASSSDVDLGRKAGLQMPRVLRRQGRLSPRERDVYELIVQGQSNKAIARTLFISESTTKVHVRHIFEKLGVHTRAEVARTSLENLP